jgi:hypothetical protein
MLQQRPDGQAKGTCIIVSWPGSVAMAKKKKKSDRLRPSCPNILDYPGSMSQYERESLAAEAKLAEQRQIKKLEELLKLSR